MFMQTNMAYIDPSVMTYAVQAIAGVVIAVGAVVAVMWRRAKKKLETKLGLEERSKKEVEDDIQLTETESTDDKN